MVAIATLLAILRYQILRITGGYRRSTLKKMTVQLLQNIKNSVTDSDQQIFLTQVFKNILVETKKYLEAKLK